MTQNTPILPDFTRWSYASLPERQWWAPLLQQASRAFVGWERAAVVAGTRKACWQTIKPEDLVATSEWAAQSGLVVIPNAMSAPNKGYSSTQGGVQPGDPFDYRCVITRPEHVKAIFDPTYPFDERMGRLFGYPVCCQRHFQETWGKGQVDSTWEQWQRSEHVGLSSTLLRWLGIRLVSHLPCRFDCRASEQRAQDFLDIAEAGGNKEEALLVKEVLRWPVKWSRLFGIAEIVTPGVKISTRSDWTPTKDAFQVEGTYNKPEAWLWTDNGFTNPDAMRAAHRTLINSFVAELPPGARVMDLGCGNGQLLQRLKLFRPDVKIAGVDRHVTHTPPLSGKWWTGMIEAADWLDFHPTAVLINPVRLLEMDTDSAAFMRNLLTDYLQVFVYAYPDTLQQQTLEELSISAQLGNPRMLQKTPGVSVGVLMHS